MTLTDNVMKKTFIDLEHFLQKVAALDVFEALIFNYKTKNDLPNPLVINFLSIVSEFVSDLNILVEEHSCQQTDAEVFSVPAPQSLKCCDNVLKSDESCQDIPLVLSFCNEDVVDKSLELVEVPVVSDVEPGGQSASCDVSDTEKTDVLICENNTNEIAKPYDNGNNSSNVSKPLENEGCYVNVTEDSKDNVLKSYDENESQEKTICKACCRKFASTSKLLGHLVKCPKLKAKNHNEDQDHKCSVCGMTFFSQNLLNSHLSEVHEKEGSIQPDDPTLFKVVEVQSLPENLPFYCCKTCLFVYKTPVDFETHSCKEVSDTMESEGYVGDYFHLLGKYLISNPDLLERMRKFRCGTCCEEYRSMNRMLYHLVRCTRGPYPCELCGLKTTSKRELNDHKRKAHRDTNSFFCDECGSAFKFRASLQKHKVNRHEKHIDTTCVQCNRTFSKRIQLTNHMIREHQAERKFLCQICGKKFSTHGSLMAHLTSHSEPFKFTCSYCNKKFRQKEKLKFHTRIHTGERPHLCPTCGKGFIRKWKLDDHMRRHRGEKIYHCAACGKSYAGNGDLKLHMKKQHPDESDQVNTPSPVVIEVKSVATKVEVNEPAEGTTATSLLSTANETLKQECNNMLGDLPEEAALTQLAEMPLSAAEPPVMSTFSHSDGKLVVQIEPSQVPNALIQAQNDSVGTRLLLHLGQNDDTSSRILVQLDGSQMTNGQTALLQPSTILTVADTLHLAPVVEDLNLNLSSIPAQYLQLAVTQGMASASGSVSATNSSNGTTTGMPVHIQLPVSAVPMAAAAISQPTTNTSAPYGLQPLPVQAVFTPTGFNVNSISY